MVSAIVQDKNTPPALLPLRTESRHESALKRFDRFTKDLFFGRSTTEKVASFIFKTINKNKSHLNERNSSIELEQSTASFLLHQPSHSNSARWLTDNEGIDGEKENSGGWLADDERTDTENENSVRKEIFLIEGRRFSVVSSISKLSESEEEENDTTLDHEITSLYNLGTSPELPSYLFTPTTTEEYV